MQSFMETFIGNLGPILLYGATLLGVFLRTRVEVLRIVRALRANQRNARDVREESDQLAHIPQSADQSEARKKEWITFGYTEESPGIFTKNVRPVRHPASASIQVRDRAPVA